MCDYSNNNVLWHSIDVTILSFLLHVLHLVQYAFQNDDYLFYVFEFAAGGMLFHHLVSIDHVTCLHVHMPASCIAQSDLLT